MPKPISEILKDKAMTVQKFKDKYLGYSKYKKPVAQHFNSNLVRTLHRMTPQLKVTPTVETEASYERSFGRNTRSVMGKRAVSQGNTISTMNKTATIFL